MQIVHAVVSAVDALQDAALPPLDEVRPASCPECGHAAHGGERLGIVGHGSYERHVLGVPSAEKQVRIRVRRFRCRGCRTTISVLPDVLHPRRWWGAWVIVEALVLHLVLAIASREIAARLELVLAEPVWRAPGRWRRQLLDRLWRWWAPSLGARGPASTRAEGRRRLERLVAQADASPASACVGAVAAQVAVALGRGTAHAAGRSWWARRFRRGAAGRSLRS